MTSSELRTGNYYYSCGKMRILSTVQPNDWMRWHVNGMEGVSGIPITKDYLTRLGFEWYEPLSHYRLVINDVWYSIRTEKFEEGEVFVFTFCNLNWDETKNMPPKVVQYVHRLQNLMFELSNQELIYKA